MRKKPIKFHQLRRLEVIRMFIRNYRINDRLSQSEFSKLSETHKNTIQRFETENKNITVLTLFNFIDAMDMTLEDFFAGME
jgi:transcriptional regulator with XRE-family HTH domain